MNAVLPFKLSAPCKVIVPAVRFKSCPSVPIAPLSVIVPVVVMAVIAVGKVKPLVAVKLNVPKSSVPLSGVNAVVAVLKVVIFESATTTLAGVKQLELPDAHTAQLGAI